MKRSFFVITLAFISNFLYAQDSEAVLFKKVGISFSIFEIAHYNADEFIEISNSMHAMISQDGVAVENAISPFILYLYPVFLRQVTLGDEAVTSTDVKLTFILIDIVRDKEISRVEKSFVSSSIEQNIALKEAVASLEKDDEIQQMLISGKEEIFNNLNFDCHQQVEFLNLEMEKGNYKLVISSIYVNPKSNKIKNECDEDYAKLLNESAKLTYSEKCNEDIDLLKYLIRKNETEELVSETAVKVGRTEKGNQFLKSYIKREGEAIKKYEKQLLAASNQKVERLLDKDYEELIEKIRKSKKDQVYNDLMKLEDSEVWIRNLYKQD